jgi:hypothetical protein
LNTFDFALIDPAVPPALGDIVHVLEPAWDGTVVSVSQTDPPKGTTKFYRVVATNPDVAYAAPAPFGLSDNPDNATTYGYEGLEITASRTDTGDENRGSCRILVDGLWPGMTVPITSANFALVARQYTVSNVTITWPVSTAPVYAIEFGDAMVTLSAWVGQTATDDILPITSTKITDGAVTTPKLAANAVTANEIAAGSITAPKIAGGAVTAEKLSVGNVMPGAGNAVLNPSFEDLDPSTGLPAQWTKDYQVVGAGATYSQHPSASSGSWAMSIAVASVSDGGAIASRAIPVTPGDVYYCSVMVGASGASTGGLYFRAYFGTTDQFTGGAVVATVAIVPDSSNIPAAYTKFDGYVTVPAAVTWMRLSIYNFLPGTARTMVVDDVSAERTAGGVANSDGNVLINAAGIVVTNGKITVTNPGSTVVIDGTSNMFKIAATGTLDTGSVADDSSGSATVDLASLAPRTSSLAMLAMIGTGTAASDARRTAPYLDGVGVGFVAATSGGAVTSKRAIQSGRTEAASSLVGAGTDTPRVTISFVNRTGAAVTRYLRYYLLQETAI